MINEKKEKEKLENEIELPIGKLKFEKDSVKLFTVKDNLFAEIGFTKVQSSINYEFSEKLIEVIDWGKIIEDERENIRKAVIKTFEIKDLKFTLTPTKLFCLDILDETKNILYSITAHYEKSWQININTEAEVVRLRNQVALLNTKQNNVLNPQPQAYYDSQNKVFEKGLELASKVFQIWLKKKSVVNEQEIQLINQFENKELEAIKELDKRDKIYKGIILSICIGALLFTSYYDKTSSIAPIIGVIIGLVLQRSNVSEYFSGATKKKRAENSFFDED